MLITTFIVYQDETFLTASADVAENILHTTMNIDIALTFEQVVMCNTL